MGQRLCSKIRECFQCCAPKSSGFLRSNRVRERGPTILIKTNDILIVSSGLMDRRKALQILSTALNKLLNDSEPCGSGRRCACIEVCDSLKKQGIVFEHIASLFHIRSLKDTSKSEDDLPIQKGF
ncbi:uncharacterized protein LOC131882242 [Tigriopus californicus]|uniref:uncharacterized protein LOC131882242 n=1 Tax=Tigriopus californicus TaxID=6832 RepID=UPI0027D9F262|nr:uncharacterized protein LOC131882242 [Tigriopus californicus]